MVDLQSYPLQWPVGQPRTPPGRHQEARFYSSYRKTSISGEFNYRVHSAMTIAGALQRLRKQIALLGASDLVVSSNMQMRNDGLPLSRSREPDDPGVAVYCRFRGQTRCFPCDRWDRLADNIAAVAAHIGAMRSMDRWGVGSIDQLFAGYKALPAMGESRHWWQTLGFKELPTRFELAKLAAVDLLHSHHPDKGGNVNQAAEINDALDQARRYFRVE